MDKGRTIRYNPQDRRLREFALLFSNAGIRCDVIITIELEFVTSHFSPVPRSEEILAETMLEDIMF
jgi:hypothetical protein